MTHDPLWDAYRNTTYQASTPVVLVSIRIGDCSAELTELLRLNKATEWLFITADNPASEQLKSEENQVRREELRADLLQRGSGFFPGQGIGADPSWPPEESLLVLGVSREAAIEMGRKYGQNAVVWGCHDQPAELVDCRGACR